MEFSACATPVVATDIGAIPDIIHGDNTGILFRVGDVKRAAYSIIKLLEDNELKNKMGKLARKKAESEFSFQVFTSKLWEFITNI